GPGGTGGGRAPRPAGFAAGRGRGKIGPASVCRSVGQGSRVMSFLLMVFLTLVCLYEGYPEPGFGLLTREGGALLTWVGVAIPVLQAWWIARRVSRPLTRAPALRDRLLRRYEWARFYHQLILAGFYLLALGVFGWGWVVGKGELPEGDNSPHGAELLLLAPFLTAHLPSRAFLYPPH